VNFTDNIAYNLYVAINSIWSCGLKLLYIFPKCCLLLHVPGVHFVLPHAEILQKSVSNYVQLFNPKVTFSCWMTLLLIIIEFLFFYYLQPEAWASSLQSGFVAASWWNLVFLLQLATSTDCSFRHMQKHFMSTPPQLF